MEEYKREGSELNQVYEEYKQKILKQFKLYETLNNAHINKKINIIDGCVFYIKKEKNYYTWKFVTEFIKKTYDLIRVKYPQFNTHNDKLDRDIDRILIIAVMRLVIRGLYF